MCHCPSSYFCDEVGVGVIVIELTLVVDVVEVVEVLDGEEVECLLVDLVEVGEEDAYLDEVVELISVGEKDEYVEEVAVFDAEDKTAEMTIDDEAGSTLTTDIDVAVIITVFGVGVRVTRTVCVEACRGSVCTDTTVWIEA